MLPEKYGEHCVARARRPLTNLPQCEDTQNHFVTFGSGFGLRSSEITFVSSRNALTVRPSAQSPAYARDRSSPWLAVTRRRIWRDSSAAGLVLLIARTLPRQG